MTSVRIGEIRVRLREGETVLDGLLRAGVDAPYHCRVGGCQTCLLILEDGSVPEEAVAGLAAPLRERGYFFACICVPLEDIAVRIDGPPRPDAPA